MQNSAFYGQLDAKESFTKGGEQSLDAKDQKWRMENLSRAKTAILKTLGTCKTRCEIGAAGSNKFNIVLSSVDDLYHNVKRPREQVADAEALLCLTNTVVESLQLRPSYSISPSVFISWLLKGYSIRKRRSKNTTECLIIGKSQNTVNWEKIGAHTSLVFMECKGCKTILGVLKTEYKPTLRKKFVVYSGYQKPEVFHSFPNEIAVYRKMPLRKVYLTRPTLYTMGRLQSLQMKLDGQASISTDETGSRFPCEIGKSLCHSG
ncbi:hypothetical protein CQW23_14332 [Capsicum baccatum]|uniref:Non-structural maintenance of chromosomes element 4 n=1 Tax=Capsicum baccatum TaxID=33114 RepID=A0A2G2WIW0_CAPBA|nr:hypothetical protein CQW23_14332 [Capsicum baccatum]